MASESIFDIVCRPENDRAIKKVKEMIQDNDTIVFARDVRFATPFLRACEAHNPRLASELLNKKANAFATDNLGWNAVHYVLHGIRARRSVTRGANEILFGMLNRGAMTELLSQTDYQGMSPLHFVTLYYPMGAARELEEKRFSLRAAAASISNQDNGSSGSQTGTSAPPSRRDGSGPRDATDGKSDPTLLDIMVLLLRRGQDPMKRNEMGDNAIDIAQSRGAPILRMLLRAMAEVAGGVERLKKQLLAGEGSIELSRNQKRAAADGKDDIKDSIAASNVDSSMDPYTETEMDNGIDVGDEAETVFERASTRQDDSFYRDSVVDISVGGDEKVIVNERAPLTMGSAADEKH